MKVLWQQILAFLVVLLTALTISAIRISDYVSEQVYSEAEARLLQYGQTIMAYDFTRSDLAIVSQVLTDEDVYVQFYLSDGRLIYPTYNDRSAVKITAKELADLQAGKTLQLRQTRRFGQNDEVVPLVTVLLPYYEETSDFPPGFIGLSTTVANLNSRVNAVQQDIYVSFLLAGILGVLLSVGYAYYQTRKIQTLQQATRQITQGNYEVNLSLDSKDEFGDLAHDFRLMASSLKNAQEEIKRQEKLRRQFMMDAAHEMRTPLTTMSGIVEGLQHDLIPENHRARSLELIGKETQRLIRLVNENLDYEKIRSNQLILKKQTLKVVTLFQQIKQQLDEKAAQKGNTIRIVCADSLLLWVDYDRMVQILMNLVTNAIQFSTNSPITLSARQKADTIELIVEDEGIGIDPEHIQSIWERFYKVDISRKNTEFGESGIGLAVVQSLVQAHDGTIQVESQQGKGTRFIIQLPHAPQEKE